MIEPSNWVTAEQARDYKKWAEEIRLEKEIKYLMDQIQGRIKEAAACGENKIKVETGQYPKEWETIIKECIKKLTYLGFNTDKTEQLNLTGGCVIARLYVGW